MKNFVSRVVLFVLQMGECYFHILLGLTGLLVEHVAHTCILNLNVFVCIFMNVIVGITIVILMAVCVHLFTLDYICLQDINR